MLSSHFFCRVPWRSLISFFCGAWYGQTSTQYQQAESIWVARQEAQHNARIEAEVRRRLDEVLRQLASDRFRFLRVNFANGDMVGHTGVFDAAKKAVEAVDTALGRLLVAVKEKNGVAIVTAVNALPASDTLNRARTAAYLVMTAPQYQVER